MQILSKNKENYRPEIVKKCSFYNCFSDNIAEEKSNQVEVSAIIYLPSVCFNRKEGPAAETFCIIVHSVALHGDALLYSRGAE
jgi:hypothetical protein